MKKILNHRASGLPTILSIVSLILGIAATLTSTVIHQAQLVEKNIKQEEEYLNATYHVDASVQIIMRELNLDSTYLQNEANLQAIQDYLNVIITPSENYTLYSVSQSLSNTQSISSYLSTTGEVALPEIEQADILNFLPVDDLTSIGDMITLTVTTYMDQYVDYYGMDPIDYVTTVSSIKKMVSAIEYNDEFSLISASALANGATIAGHYFINGSLTINPNSTLVIEDGYTLFVDGSLTVGYGATIQGNLVVFNNVTFEGLANTETTLIGTLYVGNRVTINSVMNLGSEQRPTFFFADGDIVVNQNITGNSFFICHSFSAVSGQINGDVIAETESLGTLTIGEFNLMDIYEELFSYALPFTLIGGSYGNFVYTIPRIG